MMPTRSFIVCCSSWWTVYGFSPSSVRNGSSAVAVADSIVPVRGGRVLAVQALDVVGGADTGPPAEHQQVGQRVAAEPVGAVHAAGHLARREQPGHARGRTGVGIDLDTTHHVVAGRPDLHRLLGDVDVGQFLELVGHRRQPLHDLRRRPARRDVQEHATVRRPAPLLDLGVDGSRHLVAGEQIGRALVVVGVVVPTVGLGLVVRVLLAEHVRHVLEHEPLALGVAQHTTVTADGLGDQDALDRGRPDHARGVELHELHVQQGRAGPQRQRMAVTGVLPRVAVTLNDLPIPPVASTTAGARKTTKRPVSR